MNAELWGNTEEQEDIQPKRRSFIDDLGDAINAISANFTDVRRSGELSDLRHEIANPDYDITQEEYDEKKRRYAQVYAEQQEARNRYAQAHKNLVDDDSFLKNIDQLGGTLEGMAAQGIGTAVGAGLGAGLGFLSPVAGGTAMGAKVGAKAGNAVGAAVGGYLDAKGVASQAAEEVLRNGGTLEQAEEAFYNTLPKAALTTLPETLVDVATGNRLVRAGLNSGVARKIAGSTLGRMGSAVLDPAAKIGTKAAFKSGQTLVGRGAGILADTALQGSTEAGQEVLQDYIENREVAKAMGQKDNEYSLGGFKDYALSDEGLETMKTAGIMGALFGGVGGTLSSGQYLTRGAETNTGIRAHNNTEKMINDGTLKIDKERRQDEEKIISALTGISPTELATWSDADIVAEASILEGQYMGVIGEAEDMSTTRGAADVVRRLTSKEDNTIHREGDVTETSRAFLKGMGVDDGMINRMFNSPVEKSLMEKARKEEEQAAKQEKTGEKQQTTARLTGDTAESMRENEGKSAIENIKEEAQQNKTEIATENTPSNNLGSAAKQQEQQGKIDTSDNIEYKDSLPGNWEADPQEFEKDAMLDQQSYYNANTNKKAVIARATDGGFNVVTDLNEERGDTPHFDTLEAAENYLTGKQNDINFQETNGEQTKEGTTEDPNIVPEGGVDARGNSHSGELINSVDDLFNFMQQNPGIIGRGEFIEFVHAKHNLGVNDLSMYIDRKNEGRAYNEQTGQWGYVNAKKFHDEATGRAMIQLYRGGDIISAVHEIAHVGYENLSVQDKATFNRYAVKSMGQWIADMLDLNYDDNFKQRLHNLQNDEELRKKIEESPALRQTVITFLNAEQNGVDLNHLTADQIRAIDERWAWEFSLWYSEGYLRGVEPQNMVQRIYQRGVKSLERELNMLQRLWEHIHHKDNQDIESLYTDKMNASAERPNTSGQTASPDMRFTSELEMTQMPNVNTGMNFGGEQAIQYNVPTLGESYNDAQEYAGLYNELERRYANRQKNKGLPSADGSVATNKQRPTNSEGTRTTTTGYKERTTVPAKNKKEAEKLVKIIEGKKSGWEKALEKLAYVDPKRFRSVKVESGNDLWNDQQEQARSQQEENNKNVSNTEPTNSKTETRPLPQINFTTPSLESQPMSESVTRANGINTGRPLYFNPTSEQTMNKMETIKKEQQEKRERLEKKRDLIEEKLKKAEDLFKRRTDDEELKKLLNEINLELLRYSAINGFFESSYSLKESKYDEFIERVRKIEEALKKEREEQKQIEKEIKNDSKKKIEYVNKNFTGVNGLSDSTKEVVYDAYKVLSTKGNNLITSLAKENAVLYARICDRIAKAYNENEGSNKYNAKDIYDRVSLKVSNMSNLTKRGSYSASEHHDRSGNRLIDLTKRVIKTFSQASPSTFLHETTHMYYWELELIASKYPNSQAAKDFKVLNDFANYKGEAEEKKYAQSLGETKGKTAELYIDRVEKEKDPDTKKHHMWVYRQEKIAQAFEEYIREGKSPNEELKSVFERFKDWILKFFGLTEQIGIKASPEVKAVFDRMVMTDEEIKQRSEEQQKTNKTEAPQNNQQTKTQTSQKKTAKKPTENVTPVVEQSEKQAKPTTPTDEIYSHLYFGDKTGKLKYNKDTKKIEYFVEEENGRDPVTMRRRYKLVNKGEITPEQYNELRLKYEQDFKKTKGEAKGRIPNLVEGMKKEDFMYSAYREVKQSEKEKGEVTVELGKEKQTLVTGKSEEYARQNAAEQSFNRAMSVEGLSGMEETELMKEDKEEAQKQIEQELPKIEKKKTEQTTTPKTSTTTTKKTTSTKTTASKPKTTDPLSALHKKYKNITGTPIGEKGYRFKDDEKQFITAFKQNIDKAVGNKEELLKVSKQLDGWFQNNPTERNRMVRKYLSQYLADAAQINTNQNTEVRHQEANRTEQAQEILDSAFPDTRFQFAWHSTEHDFTEFTLDHLLSGEGAMAHGWGLYFGIDLQKNKTNYFDKLGRSKYAGKFSYYVNGHDVTQQIFNFAPFLLEYRTNDKFMAKLQEEVKSLSDELNKLRNGVNSKEFYKDSFSGTMYHKGKQAYVSSYTGEIVNKDDIDDYINFIANELRKGLVIQRQIREHGLKIQGSNKNKLLLVDIPDNKYLIREGVPFSKQSPFVQSRLVKAFSFVLGLDRKDALTLLKTTDKKYYRPKRKNHNYFTERKERHKNNLYKFLMDVVEERDANEEVGAPIYGLNLIDPDTGEIIESFDSPQEMASKALNRFGIKGISYNGFLDGECAVIFDDKAIDIITKFRQEEGKWESEKVDNARNREVDKQKAQRKLEKHLTKIKEGQQALNNAFPNTRFQFAYHGTKYDFDRFTLEHLGKGQGQAVAGWGLYFTKHQDVAKAYHDYLSRGQERGQVVLVNIPEDDKLLHELKPFKEHPKHIQIKIAQAFRDAQREIIDNIKKQQISNSDKREFISEVKNYLLKIDHNDFDTIGFAFYESLVDAYDYTFMNQGFSKSYRQYKSKELASKVLNKNGIEGISYYGKDSGARRGLKDRESFVIFNDKAIKILDRIKKVNGEWVSEKGDNSAVDQRDIDLAQRKLEKRRQQDDGTRFMFGAAGAKNQTILNTNKEKQFEKHFRAHMKLRGFSEKFIDDYFSNNKNGEEQIIDDDKLQQKSLFNKTFIDTFNEYNNMMQKKAGVKRGLDGRWRFEFSDKDSHFDKNSLSNNFLDMVTNLPKQKGMAGKLSGKLQDVFDHKLLYKYYPQFKELKISFCTADYFKKTGLDLNVVGAYNNGEILINIDYLKKQKTIKAREVEVKQTILHEIQHAIQDYEGLAEGAGSTSFERQLRQRKLVDSYIKKLGGQKEAGQKLLNAINDVIKNIKKVPRNKRGDLYKKIRNNAEYFNDTEQNFVLKNPRAIIEGYMNNYQDVNKKYGRYFDNEVKEMCEYLSLSKDLGLNRELLRPIDQYQKLYWTHLGEIEARQTEQRMDMTDEERLKRTDVLDEGIKNLDILKDAPLVIKRTAEYSPNSNDAPLFQESNAPKNKKMTDEEREEKEYNKRKERVEKAKEEGTLSDQMKDVYSVSFTKSAQEYAENRTKMEYFDNNEDYWDRTEDKSTGKVTYVRKTPYEHQQKVVTYNGVNDVKRENKKKSKPVQWIEWMKDQLIKYMFNDKHYLAKAARKLGVYDAYRRMIVTEGYALKANTALTQGIKYNGKTTRALNDIIRDVGEPKQKEFLKYCIAHRILDLKDRENPVFQKMKPDEARKYIEEIKASPDAELFERNRKDFVEYNKALLHVLVDGGIIDEKTFQKFCDVDPNFVPLTKVMDDADMGFSSIINAHNLVNLKSPIKKISTSMLEIANPFLEMQKRTAEYYAIASRNKAGQIFVNEIAGALDVKYNGDVIARGQQMLHRVRVDERNGQLITKPDDKQQIIYVCNNGKHEFYQVADREIYQALTFMNADQMGTIHKMLDKIAHVPSGLVRETATMVPDFGVRNVIRDGGEAFLTSEHGFLPVIDQIWGMWQVINNTEWAQMYFNQNGEYGTLNRDRVNSEGIASVDDVIDEKLNPLKNFKEIKQAQMAILKDKQRQFSILTDIKDGNFGDAWEHARKSRGMAALKLAISPLWAIGKSNKRMNDLFELGTRVGEFKNAKMGFEGTLDRLARGIMNTNLKEAEFQKKAQSDVYAAHVAKDITLNFSQHGKLGKELNRYIPFFNASLQGIYKLCNTLETMATGTTISGGKNRRLQQELLFKAALITAMAVGVAAAGDGDEDYEEAPDYEKENFWILPNGLRFPKDQVLGKIIGNTVEKSYAQWKKGKAEPSTILKSILENFKPDRFMFAIFDLAIGGFGNQDTFKERSIVPEYMADKLGHLQKDISTSNFAVDVSEALWKCGFDISAKKIDWALQKNFSNCAKYATAIYDLGKKTFNPKEFNERIARGYDKNDSTGSMVAGLKDDIPSPINLVSGTFATNRSTFKSISDFYENYKKYKKLSSDEASMSKEDKRMWKRYEQAYKKDMTFRKQLRAIKQDRTLTGKQKREKADKIFKQQIKLAKWAEG